MPSPIKNILPYFPGPMVAGLMNSWTDSFDLIIAFIGYTPDSSRNILLQQHSPPPPLLSDTSRPPSDLPFIVIAPTTLEEPTIPLEPTSNIMIMIDPAICLPFFYGLTTLDAEFVDGWVIRWASQVAIDIESFYPLRRQLVPVVGDGDP